MNRLQQIDRERTYWNRERLKLTHPLYQLFWECTLRCNLSCLHCGSDCKKITEQPDMPMKDFLPVLDIVRHHQPGQRVYVHTVGGEPLLRKDIIECGRAIRGKGFLWGMVTNAFLLDKSMMKELSVAGLNSLAVSLDGLKEEHNWLRNHSGSFDRVYQAIGHICQTPNLLWDVITCVNQRNLHLLPEMRRMLVEAGVKQWRCFTIVPMGRARKHDELILSDEQLLQLMDFIVETRKKRIINLSYACEGFLGDYEGLVRRHHFNCQAGLTVASVLADGGISGCLSIRSHYRQGNIYHDNFWDVWNNRFQPYRNHEWMRTGVCAECDMFRYCEGNGFHLRDDEGHLMRCHYNMLNH